MAKIVVSFKDKEDYLYKHVKDQMSESVYIKQLIKKDIESTLNKSTAINTQKSNSLLDF